MMEKLLLVDDNNEIRKQLKWGLGKEYKIILAEDVDTALKLYKKHQPGVVTLDLGLPPDIEGASEGFRCLEGMLAENHLAKIIVLSGNDERENVLQAINLGAYDFYQKPIDLAELRVILNRAFNLSAIEAENRRLQSALMVDNGSMGGMLGQCPQMLEVFATIKKVATVDVPILVLGESGTGKELVGRAIHSRSLRKDGAFIPINCGAIPENLLESELFGHEKGAFTGAQSQVRGKVEYAHEGTLLLDEIGEMPALLQVKILRFLQEKVIQRVGGRADIAVDARIIAATNIDIEKAIAAEKFREDLYYRIGVITITLPPLRERGDDIALLARYFLKRFSNEFNRKIHGFSNESMAVMHEYAWPGNVRELENKIKRAVVMAEGLMVEPWDMGLAERPVNEEENLEAVASAKVDNPEKGLGGMNVVGMTIKEARNMIERELLVAAMEQHDGNIVVAAKALGVSRPTFYDLMKKHGMH